MNKAEKKLAVDVAKKMLLVLGIKWVIIFGTAKAIKKAAERASE